MADVRGQLRRPVRVILQIAALVSRNVTRRLAASHWDQMVDDLLGNMLKTWSQFVIFLDFGHLPAVLIFVGKQRLVELTVEAITDSGRRHKFRVGGQWIGAASDEPRIAIDKLLPSAGAIFGHVAFSLNPEMQRDRAPALQAQ